MTDQLTPVEELTYEQAFAELEAIVAAMEADEQTLADATDKPAALDDSDVAGALVNEPVAAAAGVFRFTICGPGGACCGLPPIL